MSEFKVEVVRVGQVRPHPNADRLDITDVHGGYPCIVKRGEFREGDLAVYVPVDAVVPVFRPEFAFLRTEEGQTNVLIKARKLRGVFSMGLLIPAPEGTLVGQNMKARYGILKWEPVLGKKVFSSSGGENEPDQEFLPVYTDLEGLRRWPDVLEVGEEVIITEKIHGQNARFVYHEGKLWAGSHHKVKRRPHKVTPEERWRYERSLRWWKVCAFLWTLLPRSVRKLITRVSGGHLSSKPHEPRDVSMTNWWFVAEDLQLEQVLSMVPDLVVYGEIYGPVQDLRYDSPNRLRFRAFDALDLSTRRYLDYEDFARKMALLGLETVPLLYSGPWSDACRALAEGPTTVGGEHTREGIVIRPAKERLHPRLGRVILKFIGEGYLLRKEK